MFAGAFALLCVISALFVGPSMWRAARDGNVALQEGARAVSRKDAAAAEVEFASAAKDFRAARQRISSPLALPLRVLPIASTHIGVTKSLSRIGMSVASSGVAVAEAMRELPEQQLTLKDGRIDLLLAARAEAALAAAIRESPEIERAIRDMPTGWVGGPLAGPRRLAVDVLPSILDGVRKAEAAVGGLSSILAEGSSKRYLIAFSNLSELRGSGGLFGYVTALKATDGTISLEKFSGRPTEILPEPRDVGLDFPTWFPDDFKTQAGIFQNINMTTDFPTVGTFVLKTAESKAGPLDGVIALDPIGIGAILGLTGPIRLPSWPEAISADNVAEIAMHDVYIAIPNNDRREAFFKQLVRTAFGRLVSSEIQLTPQTIGAFDLPVRGGHFRMYSEHAADQSVFDRLGLSGAVRRASGASDVVSVVSLNATGNKGDWFLRRDVKYIARLDPDKGTATGELSVSFRNTAPSLGLPDYIIGSPLESLPRGTNRQILMFLRSGNDESSKLVVDDKEVTFLRAVESNLRAYRSTVDVPLGGKSTAKLTSSSPDAVVRQGDERIYRLHVLRQAVANPDFAEIYVEVPKGWTASGKTTFLGDLTEDVVLEVHLTKTVRGSIVRALFTEPLRLAGDLLGRLF